MLEGFHFTREGVVDRGNPCQLHIFLRRGLIRLHKLQLKHRPLGLPSLHLFARASQEGAELGPQLLRLLAGVSIGTQKTPVVIQLSQLEASPGQFAGQADTGIDADVFVLVVAAWGCRESTEQGGRVGVRERGRVECCGGDVTVGMVIAGARAVRSGQSSIVRVPVLAKGIAHARRMRRELHAHVTGSFLQATQEARRLHNHAGKLFLLLARPNPANRRRCVPVGLRVGVDGGVERAYLQLFAAKHPFSRLAHTDRRKALLGRSKVNEPKALELALFSEARKLDPAHLPRCGKQLPQSRLDLRLLGGGALKSSNIHHALRNSGFLLNLAAFMGDVQTRLCLRAVRRFTVDLYTLGTLSDRMRDLSLGFDQVLLAGLDSASSKGIAHVRAVNRLENMLLGLLQEAPLCRRKCGQRWTTGLILAHKASLAAHVFL
mmetsp:Transcript_356/g.746  ORF Transcript_356/g.746 Transcript_356/m.746 type:complete len:433 (-) Transcript_356:251-1549(-)